MYQNIILKNHRAILGLLIITILSFGYFTKDFRLDASSETLLIDGDPDLAYLKEVSEDASNLKSFEWYPKVNNATNKIIKVNFGFLKTKFW